MDRVLVIMPLGMDREVSAKRQILAESFGSSVWLPDMTSASQHDFNVQKTIERLGDVCFVIADLSYERPSCYYELGIVQGLRIPTFLISKKDTELHQHHGRVHRYDHLKGYAEFSAVTLVP